MISENINHRLFSLSITKFEQKYMLYLIISRFYVFSSVWLVFLYSLGYSLQIVLLFNIITLSLTVTLEIPAGYVAETFGHKKILLIAYSIYSLSVVILLFNYSFIFLLISNCLWGIGNSLSVDTEDIWLYNQLMAQNKYDKMKTEDEFSKIYTKFIFLGFISTGIGEIIGSISFGISIAIPLLLSAIMMLMTVFLIHVVPNVNISDVNPLINSIEQEKNFVTQMREFSSLPIFKLIIGLILLNSTIFCLIIWFPNYLVAIYMGPSVISIVIGCGTFVIGLGIIFSRKLSEINNEKIIRAQLLVLPILIMNLTVSKNFVLIASFFAIQTIYGSLIPYYRSKLIINLPSDKKTIYLSIIGVIGLAIYVIMDLLTGFLILIVDFNTYFRLLALFLTLIIIPLIYYIKKNQIYY